MGAIAVVYHVSLLRTVPLLFRHTLRFVPKLKPLEQDKSIRNSLEQDGTENGTSSRPDSVPTPTLGGWNGTAVWNRHTGT